MSLLLLNQAAMYAVNQCKRFPSMGMGHAMDLASKKYKIPAAAVQSQIATIYPDLAHIALGTKVGVGETKGEFDSKPAEKAPMEDELGQWK